MCGWAHDPFLRALRPSFVTANWRTTTESAIVSPPLPVLPQPSGITSLVERARRQSHHGLGSVRRVLLDKREGSVKDKDILCRAEAPLFSPERLRTKALEISR
jgi:hypothetical protein